MHIPVFLAGFICGPVSGVIVGLLAPTVSFLITGMPPSYAVPLMTMELAIYGLVAGLTYVRLKLNIYIALLVSIVFGRVAFALGLLILGLFIELPYGIDTYVQVAVIPGLPGILLQIVIVPPIVAALVRKRKL